MRWHLVVAAVALFLSVPASAEAISGHPRVIDGDTLAFGDLHVRLEGIDAPERKQLCQDRAGSAYRCGISAAAALTGKIGGSSITCSGSKQDRYGRLLGDCQLGQEDLNGWMVANGWAVAYRRYSARYDAEEKRAHAAGAGIWAGSFDMPADWRRSH